MPSDSPSPQRTLGKTAIQITPIGLGLMEFGGGGGLLGFAFPVIPQEDKNRIVQAALDGGINWFDTAELYGRGVSENSLRLALQAAGKVDGEVKVATKWWPLLRTAGNIQRSIHERLRFLDGYSIDLYQVHQPYGFSSPEAEMDAMADLVEAGLIKSVGVSNFSEQHMRRAHKRLEQRGLPLASNQVLYSLVDRRIERNGILKAAKELGVTIIAYTPLGSGLLSGKYHKNPDLLKGKFRYWRIQIKRDLEKTRPLVQALEEIGAHYDATAAQVALNWLIHFHGETVVTIPGATKVNQVEQAAAAMNFKLADDELKRLDELSRLIQ